MTTRAPRTVPLHLHLLHSHPLGELARYFEGLLAGRAIASRCPVCARTWFPPRLNCPDHRDGVEWVELAGSGRLASVTQTTGPLPFGTESAPRAFALVALDGAENMAFARLATLPGGAAEGRRVWISRAPGDWPHPAQAVHFVFSEEDRRVEPLP